MSDRIMFLRCDGSHALADLDECDAWINPTLLRLTDADLPPPSLYRTPDGDYFRKLHVHDLIRAGISCVRGAPRRYAEVASAEAEAAIQTYQLLRMPAKTPRDDAPRRPRETDLDPGSLSLAAAVAIEREGGRVSLKAACKRAGVDRGNVRENYPAAYIAIRKMSAMKAGDPKRGHIDRRTGQIEARDEGWT